MNNACPVRTCVTYSKTCNVRWGCGSSLRVCRCRWSIAVGVVWLDFFSIFFQFIQFQSKSDLNIFPHLMHGARWCNYHRIVHYNIVIFSIFWIHFTYKVFMHADAWKVKYSHCRFQLWFHFHWHCEFFFGPRWKRRKCTGKASV